MSISMREAVALPLVATTAYEGLMRAGVGGGQKVLVQGGAEWADRNRRFDAGTGPDADAFQRLVAACGLYAYPDAA